MLTDKTELVYILEEGEKFLSFCFYEKDIIMATTHGVYKLTDGKCIKIGYMRAGIQ